MPVKEGGSHSTSASGIRGHSRRDLDAVPLVGGHPVPCGFVCRLIGIAPRRLVLPSPPSSQLWQGRNFPPAGPESDRTVSGGLKAVHCRLLVSKV